MEHKKSKKYFRILGLGIVAFSIGLLIREALQYNDLPSKADSISELVDYFKYKEDALRNSMVWFCFLILGLILYLKKRKVEE